MGAVFLCHGHEASVGVFLTGLHRGSDLLLQGFHSHPLPRVVVDSARFTPRKQQIYPSTFGSLSHLHPATLTKVSRWSVPLRRVDTLCMSDDGCRDVIALERTFRNPLKVQEELRTPLLVLKRWSKAYFQSC